jgi:hypothetical protein
MLNLQTIRSTRGSIDNLGTGLRRGYGNAALQYRKTRPDKAAAQPDPLKTHANGAFDLRRAVGAVAAGYVISRAGHHVGFVRSEEHDCRPNRPRFDPRNAERRVCAEFPLRFSFKDGGRLFGLETIDGLCVTLAVLGQRRIDKAGNDGVDGDVVLPELQRRRFS